MFSSKNARPPLCALGLPQHSERISPREKTRFSSLAKTQQLVDIRCDHQTLLHRTQPVKVDAATRLVRQAHRDDLLGMRADGPLLHVKHKAANLKAHPPRLVHH